MIDNGRVQERVEQRGLDEGQGETHLLWNEVWDLAYVKFAFSKLHASKNL